MNFVHNYSATKALKIVCGGKGGISKSMTAANEIEAAKSIGLRMIVATTDITNADLVRLKLATRGPIDLRDEANMGYIYEIVDELKAGRVDHATIDTAAGQTALINAHLPYLNDELRDFGGVLVVVRPVTLNIFSQAEALEWINSQREKDMAAVIVRNLGQSREPHFYSRFMDSPKFADAIAAGAVMMDLDPLSVMIAENALNWSLTVGDVAEARFHKAGDNAAKAEEFFDAGLRRYAKNWVRKQHLVFQQKFGEAIANALEAR